MKICIVGCGNIGIVYAKALLKYDIVSPSDLLLVEKNEERRNELSAKKIGEVTTPDDKRIGQSEVVLLAVKPQDFKELAAQLKNTFEKSTLIISVMAGITTSLIAEALGHSVIVRAMPNSPIEIGMGVTGYCAGPDADTEMVLKAERLLGTTGRTVYLYKESLIDSVTAVSGSGPAYFYYFVRSLIEAGKKLGLEESTSALLVKQTMIGSYNLINNADKNFDQLIATVASKGGTTEAALRVFEENNMADIISDALTSAQKRAVELSSGGPK